MSQNQHRARFVLGVVAVFSAWATVELNVTEDVIKTVPQYIGTAARFGQAFWIVISMTSVIFGLLIPWGDEP